VSGLTSSSSKMKKNQMQTAQHCPNRIHDIKI
jgi:hypothetical protein